MSNRNKSIGIQNEGNVGTEDFFFPAEDGFPAVTVSARSLDEAQKKVSAIRMIPSARRSFDEPVESTNES